MSFLEYEKSTNLFVQAMKGTSLGATLKTITAARWAVLVPQSVILEELGLGVVSKEFLLTHTVVFNNKTPADTSFVTLNGLKGEFITTKGDAQSDGTACDSVIVDLPIEPSMSTTTPFGPATASAHCSSDDDDDSDHKSDVPSKVPSQPSVVSPKANSPTAQAILVNGRATPADSIPEEPVLQPNQQSIHVLRQTELVSEGDGFTIPVYLVADAIRAKWLSSEHNKLGWYREKRQEPRNAPHPPAKTGAISPDLYADGTNGGDAKSADGKAAGGSSPAQKPRPKFRFRDFAEKMRNSKAQDLHRMLRTFVADVNGGAIPAEQLPQRVQDFLAKMSTEIRGNPVWKDGSEQELDFAQEGLEKYVLTKIFNRTFGTDEDRKNDEALEKRLESFKFISPENLEVRSEVLQHPTWKEATQELQKLNEYKNPRDKLICITNSCKLIFISDTLLGNR
ncbi:Vacuolar protein sorting-associated protein 9A [Diplonema papillatum]|nr:Vacuolar protein sorting-associated protein 9A [Diplonema papillatum]